MAAYVDRIFQSEMPGNIICSHAYLRALLRVISRKEIAERVRLPQESNKLTYIEKLFLCILKNRVPNPSENRALALKGEFQRFGICSVSTTIGIKRSIFL